MNDDFSYVLFEARASDLKEVIYNYFPWMDLNDIDFRLLVNRDDHSSLCSAQKDYPWFMLSELTSYSKQVLSFVNSLNEAVIQWRVLFIGFLLNVSVHKYVLALGTDQNIVIDSKLLDSMFQLQSLTTLYTELSKNSLFYLKGQKL